MSTVGPTSVIVLDQSVTEIFCELSIVSFMIPDGLSVHTRWLPAFTPWTGLDNDGYEEEFVDEALSYSLISDCSLTRRRSLIRTSIIAEYVFNYPDPSTYAFPLTPQCSITIYTQLGSSAGSK
jgi:hypothetical protein